MAFKMKGSPYPKVMDQGKLGNQLKSFQNDLRSAKDDETKRKIKLDIQSTMEEMKTAGMSMDQIKNIGGKAPFAKNTYTVKMKDGTTKEVTRKEYMKFTGKKPGGSV